MHCLLNWDGPTQPVFLVCHLIDFQSIILLKHFSGRKKLTHIRSVQLTSPSLRIFLIYLFVGISSEKTWRV